MAISVGMAAVALLFYGLGTFTQNINPVDPGPAFYPRAVSLFLLAAAAIQFATSVRRKPATGPSGEAHAGPSPYRYSVGTCLLSIAYVALFDKLAYLVSAPVFLVALMLLGGVRRWDVLLGVPICYAIATYALFGYLLMVPPP
jgi:hypothetical protein